MTGRHFIGMALSIGIALCAFEVRAAEPPPQYSADDVAKTFADKDQSTTSPAGACEHKDWIRDDDGVCQPAKNERGFSLPTHDNHGGQTPAPRAESASGGTRVATAGASPRPVHHTPASRDLLITFKLGSSDLTDQGRANARVFAQALALPALTGDRFKLSGYTDATGDKDKNLILSQQRADAVKAFLVSQGVDASRLTAQGFGAQDFASPAHPNAAENRRVVASKAE